MNTFCCVCNRNSLVVTLKSCFNKDICSSCKQNYYKSCGKLVKFLTDHDPEVIYSNTSTVPGFMKCEFEQEDRENKLKCSRNAIYMVNGLCKSCRFLIGFDLFGYKIPNITMKGLSVSLEPLSYENLRKIRALCEIACVETRQNTTKHNQIVQIDPNSPTTSNPQELVYSPFSDEPKSSEHSPQIYLGRNISNWSFDLTHILNYIQNYEMSKVILKNDETFLAERNHSQLLVPCVYADSHTLSYSIKFMLVLKAREIFFS